MKVALAQLNYTVGDIKGNTSRIIDAITRARSQGVQLLVFAEQAISGTPAYDLLNKVTFLELCQEALVAIASHCEGITVVVGLPLQSGTSTISAAAVIRNRQVLRYVGKQRIDSRDEIAFLSPSGGAECFSVAGHKVAVVVGDDVRAVREWERGVDTVVNITASRFRKRILVQRYELLRDISFVGGRNLVWVNQVGGSTDVVYDGTSVVFNTRGELISLLDSFEEDFASVDLDEENPAIPSPFSYYQTRTSTLYRAIKCGLRDYFAKNGYEKACVGLSGGIDSAVVAAIAVDTLGRDRVRVMMMPSQFSSDTSVEDAVRLARNLGVEYNVVPITEAYRSIVESLLPVCGGTPFDATEENIQARIRTVMLMALQNKTGYILLNTSNKSEIAIGWCTLYGDTAGAFSVTGDVYKSEIYDLARHINSEREIIPRAILDKEPSSELRPNQKDSDYLPPYEYIDAILYRMIERGQHREEIVNAGFEGEVVEKIHGMIMRNEKKRHQFCPILRLSSCAFGRDRVLPLTNKYE